MRSFATSPGHGRRMAERQHRHGAGAGGEGGGGGGDAGGAEVLLHAARQLQEQQPGERLAALALAEMTTEELWNLVGHGDSGEGALSADKCLGGASKLMRLLVVEFEGSRPLMYDVFALTVAYQLRELECDHVRDKNFTVTVGEVLGWQEPPGQPVIGVGADAALKALACIAVVGREVLDTAQKVKIKNGDGKVLRSPDKRLALGMQRMVAACIASRAPVAGGDGPRPAALPDDFSDFRQLMMEISKSFAEGMKVSAGRGGDKEEDEDDLKAGTIDKIVEEHEKRVVLAGERPLKRQDEIVKKMLVSFSRLECASVVRAAPPLVIGVAQRVVTMAAARQVRVIRRVRDEKAFPDVTDGAEQIRPQRMVPRHFTSFGDAPPQEEGRSLQVDGQHVRAKLTSTALKFENSSQLGLAIVRFLMNVWYSACLLWDVPDKSPGEKKIGHRPCAAGTVQYAPREMAESLCVCVMQAAGIYERNLLSFDVLLTSTLAKLANDVNPKNGALTIGAAMLKAEEYIGHVVIMGQMQGHLPVSQPLTVGGSAVSGTPLTGSALASGGNVVVAGPYQGFGGTQATYQPPPYQAPTPMVPAQTFHQQGYTTSPSKKQIKRAQQNAMRKGNPIPGIVAGAAAYGFNQQLYAQQPFGTGRGRQQQVPMTVPPQVPQAPMQGMPMQGVPMGMQTQAPVQAVQPGKMNGRWLQLPGGNPYNPHMCNRKRPQPCAKGDACHMNHAQIP